MTPRYLDGSEVPYWLTGECAHCTERQAGAEGTIWCAKCLEWWRNEERKSQGVDHGHPISGRK